jgi:hypothetical protein
MKVRGNDGVLRDLSDLIDEELYSQLDRIEDRGQERHSPTYAAVCKELQNRGRDPFDR